MPRLQRLSGEWQIERTHAKGYLGDQVLFSGVGAAQALLGSEQQWRHFSAADSAPLGRPCRQGSCIM